MLAIISFTKAFCWYWTGGGWLLFLFGNYCDFHMVTLLDQMVSAIPTSAADGTMEEHQLNEGNSLLGSGDCMPLWTRIDLDQYLENGRPLLTRLFARKHHASITRQDTLYWMERKGPKLYVLLFQIQLVFTATYVSVLLFSFIPFLLVGSVQSTVERVSYLVVAFLPVYLLLTKYKVAAANLTVGTSL